MKTIDLSRPDVNAYYLMGVAKKIMEQKGDKQHTQRKVISAMMAGDYDNLLKVLECEFDGLIKLENKPGK